jgi:hypothetical protein
MTAGFAMDANVGLYLPCQEVLSTARLVDISGNEGAGILGTGSPLALQAGPCTGIFSRYVDGMGGKYFATVASSVVWQAAVQNQMTLEVVLAGKRYADTSDLRTVYALANGVTKYLWLSYYKADASWLVDWKSGGVERNFEIASPFADDVWWYLALRKTVTSGTTISNRLSTWDCWLLPLAGAWTDTPTFSIAGQLNPDQTDPAFNCIGAFYQGGVDYFGSFRLAGLRGSTVPRTADELHASFSTYAGLPPGDQVAPVVTLLSPQIAAGISRTQPLSFKVEDNLGLLGRVMVVARFPGRDVEEVIHTGTRWGPLYDVSPNSRTPIANGYLYSVLRRGGWPTSPSLDVYALDQSGNEAA